MSELVENALKSHLLQLKCHFTWGLLETDVDIDYLEDKLHYQQIFLTTKNKYIVYNLLAYVMHMKGLYTEAIAKLKEAEEKLKENNPVESNRKYLVTYGNYAWVYYYLEQFEESQIYIDKIEQIYKELKLSPNHSQDIVDIYGERGWSLLTFCGKYYEKAKECFERALEIDPEDPEWISGYATAVYRLEGYGGKKCPASECKSLSLLKRAIELHPNDAVLKALLALKLKDLDRADEARHYVEEALEQAPNNPYLVRYVAKFYRKSRLEDKALHILKTALDRIPSSAFLHHQTGLCYKQKMGKRQHLGNAVETNELLQKAIFHFEKAVEYDKIFVMAYRVLAVMYSIAKEFHKAEETFKKVLALPSLTDIERQEIHFHYGHFEELSKKCESEAIKHYKTGFQITEPSYQREDCERALRRLAEQKIQRKPRDALGFGLLGFLQKNNGKHLKAKEFYEKALQCDPHNEEYLSELTELQLLMT